jgi:predicted MPP superfamily phosphohydrolase
VWLFLATFLSIYGALNFYLFWKIHRAFPHMGWWLLAPGGFLLLMAIGPVLVHALARWGLPLLARALALLAHPWLALILWLAVLALALDLWNLAVRVAEFGAPGSGRLVLGPRLQLWILAAAVGLLGVWGLWEARSVRIEPVTVRTARLPAGSPPVRIAQIADLHMSALTSPGRLERALRLVEDARPDLVVSTGDLIDFPLPADGRMAARLAAVRPPLGKFAVFGNHELYVDRDEPGAPERFLEAAGFKVLRGEICDVGPLRLAGVDDPGHGPARIAPRRDESAVLSAEAGRPFTVLLKHSPDVAAAALSRFDLQLSGHTHGGQFIPFNLLVRLWFARVSGRYSLDGGSQLYVSRGTGTWGPPMRLLSRPEVALISIEPEPLGKGGAGGGQSPGGSVR